MKGEDLENSINKFIDELKGPMAELNRMQEENLDNVKERIDFIIRNNIAIEREIEDTFDMLLDLVFWFGEEIEELYYKFIKYTRSVNVEIANDYEEIYKEMISEDEEKEQKLLKE